MAEKSRSRRVSLDEMTKRVAEGIAANFISEFSKLTLEETTEIVEEMHKLTASHLKKKLMDTSKYIELTLTSRMLRSGKFSAIVYFNSNDSVLYKEVNNLINKSKTQRVLSRGLRISYSRRANDVVAAEGEMKAYIKSLKDVFKRHGYETTGQEFDVTDAGRLREGNEVLALEKIIIFHRDLKTGEAKNEPEVQNTSGIADSDVESESESDTISPDSSVGDNQTEDFDYDEILLSNPIKCRSQE